MKNTILPVIEKVDADNPGLIVRDPHAFTALAVATAHAIDPRVGLNGKRGNPNDTSEDAMAILDDTSPLTGSDGRAIRIIDFIIGAGSPDARPGWIDQTAETIRLGTTGVWVRPKAVAVPPPATPPPPPATPPPPVTEPIPPPVSRCKFEPCLAATEIAGLYEAFSRVSGQLDTVNANHDALVKWLGSHIDDIKGRIDAKPVTTCKSRGWV